MWTKENDDSQNKSKKFGISHGTICNETEVMFLTTFIGFVCHLLMSFKIKCTDSTFFLTSDGYFAEHQTISRHIQNDVIVALRQKVLFYSGCVVSAGWPHTEMQIYHEVAPQKEKHIITYQLHNQDLNLHLTVCTPLSTSAVRWGYCLMWQLSLVQKGNRTDPITKRPNCHNLENIH